MSGPVWAIAAELSNVATAVMIWTLANDLLTRMLRGTPCADHSLDAPPVVYTTGRSGWR